MSVGILLVDDHAIVRDGLRMLLEHHSDLRVIGAAADGREALNEARRLRPDIVIMDISMPGMNGIEAAQAICEALPATKVLILSQQAGSVHAHRALLAGARGYVLKQAAGTELVAAVRALQGGRRYLSAAINESVLSDLLNKRPVENPLELLSPRERNVLQLVVEGRSNAEAARELNLSVKTVETYRSRLMQKLGIKDLPALVKFAIEHGVTQIG